MSFGDSCFNLHVYVISQPHAQELTQYLVWDVDAVEDSTDTVSSTLLRAVDADDCEDKGRKAGSKRKAKKGKNGKRKKKAKSSSTSDDPSSSDEDDSSESSSSESFLNL